MEIESKRDREGDKEIEKVNLYLFVMPLSGRFADKDLKLYYTSTSACEMLTLFLSLSLSHSLHTIFAVFHNLYEIKK